MASAFVLAFQVPNLFRRLLGEGALTAAFIDTARFCANTGIAAVAVLLIVTALPGMLASTTKIPLLIVGYGFGASFVALFAQLHTEGLKASKRAVTIAAGREMFNHRGALGNGGNHCIAVRN